MSKIDKVIELLREMVVANAPSTGGAFGSQSPSTGPTAGHDAPVGITSEYTGKKGKVDYRKVPITYRNWVKSFKK
jgi:hypothetical protein